MDKPMITRAMRKALLLAACLLGAPAAAQTFFDRQKPVDASRTDPAELARYVSRLEAIDNAKRVQYLFGYYEDAFDDERLAQLFTADATIDVAGGKYIGQTSIKRWLALKTHDSRGAVNDHLMMQGVLDASDDGTVVLGRFRDQVFRGNVGQELTTAAGLFEVRYVKQGDLWLIAAMAYCEQWHNRYGVSLNYTPLPAYPAPAPRLYPEDSSGPDKVSNYSCHPWPYAGITPPMHYPHPVSGEFVHKP